MVRRPALLTPLALLLCAAAADARAGGAAGRGLWIGAIHVCRDSAADAIGGTDSIGEPTVTIVLRPEGRARLERETARLVERRIAVRLNGRLIMAPTVREPITGGLMELHGMSQAEAEAIRAAAGRRC